MQEHISSIQKYRMDILDEYIKVNNYKSNKNRKWLYAQLFTIQGHFCVNEIYDILRERGALVSRSSLYRYLVLLSDAGLSRQIRLSDGLIRYEFSYSQEHSHFICEKCKAIFDVENEFIHIGDVPHLEKCKISCTQTTIFGLCAKCI